MGAGSTRGGSNSVEGFGKEDKYLNFFFLGCAWGWAARGGSRRFQGVPQQMPGARLQSQGLPLVHGSPKATTT